MSCVRPSAEAPRKKGRKQDESEQREEETDSDKDVNELRIFYLFVLFDHYCKFVV